MRFITVKVDAYKLFDTKWNRTVGDYFFTEELAKVEAKKVNDMILSEAKNPYEGYDGPAGEDLT